MLFIILFFILQTDDTILIPQNIILNKKYVNKLIHTNILEGNYYLKSINGKFISPSLIDKFGVSGKLQNNEHFNNDNYWKIKKYNQYYIFDKPDSKSCLSVTDNILKQLDYEDCNKKSLCGIEEIIGDTREEDKIKTSYFNIYSIDGGNIISFNDKYLLIDDKNIKLTSNILEATLIIFEKI